MRQHQVIGSFAVVASVAAVVWSAGAWFRGPRLKDGERIVSAGTYAAEQQMFMELLALTHHHACTESRGAAERNLHAI